MFAGQYFAQWYFGGNPFEVAPPPPPPPPPVFDYSCKFGIGLLIGSANDNAPLAAAGVKGCRDSLKPVAATKGSRAGLRMIGTKGGPSEGSCP